MIKTKANEDHFHPDLSYRIVVKFHDGLHLPFGKTLRHFPRLVPHQLFTSLASETIKRLVQKAKKLDPLYEPTDFFSYYAFDCPVGTNVEKLIKTLSQNKSFEFVYTESFPAQPPYIAKGNNPFAKCQQYLEPAPKGIDAKYAWKYKGGDGNGKVKFIDVEQGWMFEHEDIKIQTLPLTGLSHEGFKDHGTAVLGIIMMKNNGVGGIGITPSAKGRVVSQWRPDGHFNNADAIMTAISYLDFGDILLLEAQCFDSPASCDLWPLEIQSAIFDTIRLATALGIIVVEAGGNGNVRMNSGNDLDKLKCLNKKFLNRHASDFRDSGAIMVGASTSDAPHKKMVYSNYGTRIDCYGWGENVATAGYFPQSSGYATNTYTKEFCGTSSASAIVAGAAIAVQNIVERNCGRRLSPQQMRDILSNESYGTSSANGRLNDKIGVMPDLKKVIDNILSGQAIKPQ